MARWKFKGRIDLEDSVKFDKIRKRKRPDKKSQDSKIPFEYEESMWHLGERSFRGRVVEVHKRYAFISPEPLDGSIDTKDIWLATVARRYLTMKKKERNLVTVGDIVLCQPTDSRDMGMESEFPTALIVHRAERKHKLARRDPMDDKVEHVVASNVDQINIVASFLKPTVKWGLIDRYLTLVEEQRLEAVIVLNKLDLLEKEGDPKFKEQCATMVALYRSLGYRVIEISAEKSDRHSKEIQELSQVLQNKVSIFSGHSGVGKSSIVNLFKPEIVQEVEENPDIFYKGRHTTTYSSFIKLQEIEAYIVDTPGVRSLLVGERSSIELTYAFREMRPLLNHCKYRECRHIDEPDCAVLKAVESGRINESRYKSYKNLLFGGLGREGRSGLIERDIPDEFDDS